MSMWFAENLGVLNEKRCKDYVDDLPSSAGGRIKRKLKTRRKSRKVRNGRRKCQKSRRNRIKSCL